MNRYVRVIYNGEKIRSWGYDPSYIGIEAGGKPMIEYFSWGESVHHDNEKDYYGIPSLEDIRNDVESSVRAILNKCRKEELPESYTLELVFVKKTSSARKKYLEGYVLIDVDKDFTTITALRYSERIRKHSIDINMTWQQEDATCFSHSSNSISSTVLKKHGGALKEFPIYLGRDVINNKKFKE